MQLDDAIDRRQTEPGPLADLLGGEKWLKDVVQRGLVHTGAGVADTEADELAGARFRMIVRVIFVDFGSERAHDELAAVGHGVAGVRSQVRNELFQHARVRQDRGEVGRIVALQRDLFAEQTVQRVRDTGNDLVQIENPRLHDLASAKCQ